MKQLLLAILLAFFVAPSAFAHTQISSTSPAHGDVVTTPITEISLTYAGKIEEGSRFTLTNAKNEPVDITSITVANGVMTGTVEQPLANGEYTVKWDSISGDGHPLSGTFSFAVKVPETEQPAVTEPIETDANQTATLEETTPSDDSVDELAEEKSNLPILIVVAILAVIIIASLVVLFTRRKG